MTLTKQEKAAKLKEWLGKTKLDPIVCADTLGVAISSISPEMWLAATNKILKVNKGEVEPDDRDSLKYSTFHGIEDYVYERIDKDAEHLLRKARMKMQQKKNLSWLHASFFLPQLKGLVTRNSLSNNVEGINPIEYYDNSHRVTKLGPGGIKDVKSVPDESRQVNVTSFGFFDPVHISESENVGVTNYVAHNVIKGKDLKLYRVMKDKDGKLVWVDHETLLNSKVKIPEH